MRNFIKIFIYGVFLSLILALSACQDDIPPVIETMEFERLLSPIGLTSKVLNKVDVQLNWKTWVDTEAYVVEYSLDSMVFGNVVKSITVMPDEIPVTVTLEGGKQYTARVKSVSLTGAIPDSKWTSVVFRTDAE